MNWLLEFPTSARVPLRSAVEGVEDWMLANLGFLFDGLETVIILLLTNIRDGLYAIPWTLFVAIVAGLAWKAEGPKLALASAAGLVFVGTLGLWDHMMLTLAIVLVATFLAVAIGIPIGILMARNSRVEAVVKPLLDLAQTMPSFVYLVPVLAFFSLGFAPGVVATWIYAIPPVIRLTALGIQQVPAETVEAAEAFGSTPRQTLFKVQLPLATPTIMAGVNQTTMMALAMVVIASIVGVGGLGKEVLVALGQLETGDSVAAGLGIVILAIVLDRLIQSLAASRRSGQTQEA